MKEVAGTKTSESNGMLDFLGNIGISYQGVLWDSSVKESYNAFQSLMDDMNMKGILEVPELRGKSIGFENVWDNFKIKSQTVGSNCAAVRNGTDLFIE